MADIPSSPAGWTLPSIDPIAAQRLAAELACPVPIAALIISRGIADSTTAQTFFNPSLEDLHDHPAVGQRCVVAGYPILEHAGPGLFGAQGEFEEAGLADRPEGGSFYRHAESSEHFWVVSLHYQPPADVRRD